MKNIRLVFVASIMLMVSPGLIAQGDGLEFHDDYYLGFSQGAYYGLMLGGVEYDIAWCVKSELAYEARKMGAGGEFQARLDSIFEACRAPEQAELIGVH